MRLQKTTTFEKGAESVAPRPGLAAGIEPPASALSAGRDLPLHGCKGGLVRDSIADIESFRPASPGWPASIGMGGRLPSESVAGLHRYQWPLCVGLRTFIPVAPRGMFVSPSSDNHVGPHHDVSRGGASCSA